MTGLFFTEVLHKIVIPFLWVIILHGISTVTWHMNSWYTGFCNFAQILFVEGTPATFCITILDFACLYNVIILWVLRVMGGLIGNLVMSLTFCIPKGPCTYLILGTYMLKESWNKMSCKGFEVYWMTFIPLQRVFVRSLLGDVLNCLVWALFSFWGGMG